MIIVDTGFWLALANQRDRYHPAAREVLEEIGEPLITTWPVMTETCHLLLSRLSPTSQERFIASFRAGAFNVFALEDSHASRIEALMEKYRNRPMDLADASLVILAEFLGDGRILSTDRRDFNAYRWKERQPFENLMPLD